MGFDPLLFSIGKFFLQSLYLSTPMRMTQLPWDVKKHSFGRRRGRETKNIVFELVLAEYFATRMYS